MNSKELQIISFVANKSIEQLKDFMRDQWKNKDLNIVVEHAYRLNTEFYIDTHTNINNEINDYKEKWIEIINLCNKLNNEELKNKLLSYAKAIDEYIYFLKEVQCLCSDYKNKLKKE